jgi:hypothetical protein
MSDEKWIYPKGTPLADVPPDFRGITPEEGDRRRWRDMVAESTPKGKERERLIALAERRLGAFATGRQNYGMNGHISYIIKKIDEPTTRDPDSAPDDSPSD